VRARLLVALVLGAAVVAAGAAFERVLGERTAPEPAPLPVSSSSGAWFCPHGGGDGWRAWVVAVNPAPTSSRVIVTTYGRSEPQETEASIPARSQRYIQVPAEGMASASVVEFFGPRIAAGMVTRRAEGAGIGAEPCADGAADRWYVPEGTSIRGQSSAIVVANPFAREAVIDVLLFTENDVVRHGNLQGIRLEPERATAIELNRFALGEETLTAEVHAALGRIVVAALGVGHEEGLRSTLGVDRLATSWVLPGARFGGPTQVVVQGPAGGEVPLRVATQDADGSTVVLEEEAVSPRTSVTFEVPQDDGGVEVQGAGPEPFAAGRRLEPEGRPASEPRPGGGRDREEAPTPLQDPASTAGLPGGAEALIVPSPLPEDGGEATLALQNPGRGTASGTMVLLGEDGPVGEPVRFSLEAGHAVSDRIDEGGKPVSVVLRLTSGEIVAAQVAEAEGGFAVATGIPVEPGTAFLGIS
jgi:Family of unknown function (DUF5719)